MKKSSKNGKNSSKIFGILENFSYLCITETKDMRENIQYNKDSP